MFACTVKWLAVGSILGLVLPGCVAYSTHAQQGEKLAHTQDELGQTTEQLKGAEEQLVDVSASRQALEERAKMAEQLQAQNAELAAKIAKMEKAGAITTPDGVTLFVNDGMYGYRAQSDVFFTPGNDTLSAEGKKILTKVANELKKNTDPVVVIGHTDSDPIVRTADKWPRGNVQLGASRALSVSEYLVSQGIPEARLSIQSCGPYQPIATGNSAEAKQKNRRVEIMVKVAGASGANAGSAH